MGKVASYYKERGLGKVVSYRKRGLGKVVSYREREGRERLLATGKEKDGKGC